MAPFIVLLDSDKYPAQFHEAASHLLLSNNENPKEKSIYSDLKQREADPLTSHIGMSGTFA